MQEALSNNSINITNSISSKMNQKIQNIFEKKSIGTTSMRQRPSQQMGINLIEGNKSSILQNQNPFLSPDRTKLTQYQQKIKGNEQNNPNNNSVGLSFLVKPGFMTQNSQQNCRQTNNSCINMYSGNPVNQLNPNHNNHNHSSINLFETGQTQSHNKQMSIGSSIQPKQKQQSNILNFKTYNSNQPNTPQNGTAINFFKANQEKRNSEQINSDSSAKTVHLSKEKYQQDVDPKHQQHAQSFLQVLTQKSSIATEQNSNKFIQKMRNTNSMSMIRPRQSQDSFLNTVIGQDNSSKQARSMLQAKKKKKSKKFRAISPASSVSTAAAAHSQLVSQTNRIKSIPSPHLTYSLNQNQIQSMNTYKREYLDQNKNNKESTSNNYIDPTNVNKNDQLKSSQQNDFIPQFFSKLKKKQMQFFQSNAKDFPQKIETSQDIYNQQEQHIFSCDNSPSYNMWLQQQQSHFQNQSQLQQSIFSPQQKNMYSAIEQQAIPNIQQSNTQQNLLDSTAFSSTLNQNTNTSKTHLLLDKLNKLHKYSQNNSNPDLLPSNQFAQKRSKLQFQHRQIISDHKLLEDQQIDQQREDQNINQKFNLSQTYQQKIQSNINLDEDFETQYITQKANQYKTQNDDYLQINNQQYQSDLQIFEMQNEVENVDKRDLLKKFEELLVDQSRNNSHKQSLFMGQLNSDQRSLNDKSSSNNVVENEDSSQQQIKQFFHAQSLTDIPLPSQTLKSNQYQQFENILFEFQNSYQKSNDVNIQQFIDQLILFSQKYIKPIPQIVRNSQQISLQYKKKDEEVNKLKIEKQNLLIEKNKLLGKQIPKYIQIQQQQQELTLKEINTPSTQIEDTNQQVIIAEQQMQIQILQKQLEEKNAQLQKMNNLYLTHLQYRDKQCPQDSESNCKFQSLI